MICKTLEPRYLIENSTKKTSKLELFKNDTLI